jgi:hypothetical protein
MRARQRYQHLAAGAAVAQQQPQRPVKQQQTDAPLARQQSRSCLPAAQE